MSTSDEGVWRGAVQPVPTGRAGWRSNADEELRALTDQGRPLLLAGYANSPVGVDGASHAIEDLLVAAADLAQTYGLDVRPDLPTREAMTDVLLSSPHVFDDDGSELRCTLLDLRSVGVVVSLATRSPRQSGVSRAEGESRSHVSWLALLLRDIRPLPAGLLVTHVDRVARSVEKATLLMRMLTDLEHASGAVWAASVRSGRWPLSGLSAGDAYESAIADYVLRCLVQADAKRYVRPRRAAGGTAGDEGAAR